MGDCSWRAILKKPHQKVGLGGLRHNIDPKFHPWKKMSSRENSHYSARENKNASRENLSNTARENPGLSVKMFKKVGVKTNFHPWKKSQKRAKKGIHGHFWFSREKKNTAPHLTKK